jgi:hypothetical protein
MHVAFPQAQLVFLTDGAAFSLKYSLGMQQWNCRSIQILAATSTFS